MARYIATRGFFADKWIAEGDDFETDEDVSHMLQSGTLVKAEAPLRNKAEPLMRNKAVPLADGPTGAGKPVQSSQAAPARGKRGSKA